MGKSRRFEGLDPDEIEVLNCEVETEVDSHRQPVDSTDPNHIMRIVNGVHRRQVVEVRPVSSYGNPFLSAVRAEEKARKRRRGSASPKSCRCTVRHDGLAMDARMWASIHEQEIELAERRAYVDGVISEYLAASRYLVQTANKVEQVTGVNPLRGSPENFRQGKAKVLGVPVEQVPPVRRGSAAC